MNKQEIAESRLICEAVAREYPTVRAQDFSDVTFFVYARTALPKALDRIEELEAERDEASMAGSINCAKNLAPIIANYRQALERIANAKAIRKDDIFAIARSALGGKQ